MLIGIPREDAVVTLPALSIPRMERRVLGSIYGSTYPERDFALTLDLYRRGRLPLDRLITHRVPLADLERGLELLRNGRGDPRGRRNGGGGVNLDALDGTIGQGWGGLSPNGSHANVIAGEARQPDGGRRDDACSRTRRRATRR